MLIQSSFISLFVNIIVVVLILINHIVEFLLILADRKLLISIKKQAGYDSQSKI